MPINPRVRSNNVFGFTTNNPLTAGATSFNSAGLANLAVILTQHAVITLDPLREFGEPEIIIVTAHTAAATVATITRGAYGTTARVHVQNTLWVHAPVTDDFRQIVTSSTRPSDPYEGQQIYETDTHRPGHRDNTQWLPGGPTSVVTVATRPANPYEGQSIWETDTDALQVYTGVAWREFNRAQHAFRVINNANQSLTAGPSTVINFQVEQFDFQNNFASNTYTVPITGLYWFNTWCTYSVTSVGDSRHILHITVNGTSIATDDQSERGVPQISDIMGRHISALLSLNPGDLVRAQFQPVVGNVDILTSLAVFEGYRIGAAQ